MATSSRIERWLQFGAVCLVGGCLVALSGLAWLSSYMTEGVLETETLQGNVLVALSDDLRARQALLEGCRCKRPFPATVSTLLVAGRLAEVPSGTKMHMTSWGDDPAVGTMTVAEGRLRGRHVRACRNQFALLHAWF